MRVSPVGCDDLDSCGRAYPRPQLRRSEWISLNGEWDCALDVDGSQRRADEVIWNRTIRVPFSPETTASGIGDSSFYRAVWYRRRLELAAPRDDQRVMLHFGAVDYSAIVWVSGRYVGRHRGGYTPFALDITDQLAADGTCEIVVRADDDPQDLAKPRGKQDWHLEPHSIWYPRTTGIWQTVWIELVPATRLGRVAFTPNLVR